MRGLLGTHYSLSEVRFRLLTRSHEESLRKPTGDLRQGVRPVRGTHVRREYAAPPENVPPYVKYYGEFTNDTTALRSGVLIDGDGLQDFGG